MTPILIALALAGSALAQETPNATPPASPLDAAAAPTAPSPAAEGQSPAATPGDAASSSAATAAANAPDPSLMGAVQTGAAPTDPFGLVSWCAGAVQGYLALKPDIFPEVKRIETQFRRPGSNLAEDLQDYADMEKDARRQMGVFQDAIGAAEKASPNDLSAMGLAAYKRGLSVWAAPTNSTKARIAQEWMSWALPATCESTAKTLVTQASLMGEAMKPTAASDPAPAPPQAEPAPTPPTGDTAAQVAPAAAPAAADQPAATTAAPVDVPKVRSVKKKKATAPAGG